MHLVLAFLGALVGAGLAAPQGVLFSVLVGVLAGAGIAEAIWMARRLDILESEVARLQSLSRREPERRRDTPAEADSFRPTNIALEHGSAVSAATPQAAAPYRPWNPEPAGIAPDEWPLQKALRDFFTGGNALVRTGVIVLFFGVAFLLRYLAEHTHVPIGVRLSAVACAGLALLVLGWYLRRRRPGYALALQGGAIGVLYLTVYAALRLYALLSPASAFPLMVLLAALCASLAVAQSSLAFALLAVTGGFLAPILASNGHGSHVVLFGYYAVLNLAILSIGWFKAWRPLNAVGFLFTFLIATAWGVLHYHPHDFPSTEPFLILFVLIYVAIAILYSTRQAPALRGYIDATIVFGVPIVGFGLQSAMLHDQRLMLALSALALSAFYAAAASWLHRRARATQGPLVEAFVALAVAFATLAVPLALHGAGTATTWALEGTALVWVGCRQNRVLARSFGTLMLGAAGVTIWLRLDLSGSRLVLPAGMYLSALVTAVASVFSARALELRREHLREYERWMPAALFAWGTLWWTIWGLGELQRRVAPPQLYALELVYLTLTALLSSELFQRCKLAAARVPALLLLPVMMLAALAGALRGQHPLSYGGWYAWPLAFAGLGVVAWRHEGAPTASLARTLHALSAWLLAPLLSWELAWQVQHLLYGTGAAGTWFTVFWALTPALLLLLLPTLTDRMRWPFALHRETYLILVAGGYAAYLGAWSIAANALMPGNSEPLRYLPLLNPLDAVQALLLFALLRHLLVVRRTYPGRECLYGRPVVTGLALIAFLALNGALLRTLHYWAGIPFFLPTMLESTLVQTALSIFWTTLALMTMLVATRRRMRPAWLAGAGLLAVVVVKLFVVDLSSIGTIERIVSFVGVGVLMLVLGYFSPLPPVEEPSA
jgi:uncharacterized membrane protein